MTKTKTLDRLGLMGIASAIALSAAVGWSTSAWSADKNAQQWQQPQHSQSQGGQPQGGQNRGGQPQMQFRPQANNQQPQFNRSGQQWSGHQQVNSQQQWQFKNQQRANNQPQFQNGNGQQWNSHQQVNNQQQWKSQNGQPSRNGQFVQQNQWKNNNNNNNQWRNAQNGQSRNVQVRTTNVTTRYDWHNYQPGHRPADWDNRNHNVDFRAYQWNRNSQVRYHYQPYNPPHGYYYRRWAYGQVFPTIFWTQNYWLTDYYSFGLDNPPYGYVWVRYGPDALLVNVYNGQILSVEYNVFYA